MLQNPERTTLRQYQIIQPIQLVAEIYPTTPALTCKTRPAPSREEHPERWPSGLRRTLGKRVCGKPYRGFESHSLRHMYFNLLSYFIYYEIDPRIDPQSGVFIWAVFKDLAN